MHKNYASNYTHFLKSTLSVLNRVTTSSHTVFLIQLYHIISKWKATSETEKEHHNQKLKNFIFVP